MVTAASVAAGGQTGGLAAPADAARRPVVVIVVIVVKVMVVVVVVRVVGAKGWRQGADDVRIIAHKVSIGGVVVHLEDGAELVGKENVDDGDGGADDDGGDA